MLDWLDTTDSPPQDPAPPASKVVVPLEDVAVAVKSKDLAVAARAKMAEQVLAKYGSSGPSRSEVASALWELSKPQRIYLEELLDCGLEPATARRNASIRLGKTLSPQRVRYWDRVPRYVAARRVLGLALTTALSPHENLLRLEKSIQLAMTPRKRYVGGTDTGEQEVDIGAMQKGIELAAKINKQLGADSVVHNRVTVQILDLTDAEAPDFSKGAVVEGSVEAAPSAAP